VFDISTVTEADFEDLLPLMRAYCVFYEVDPSDEALLDMSRALIADPEREGLQLIARDSESGAAAGFSSIFWTWSTLSASRLGIMNDLFVDPQQRGRGLADALIIASAERAGERGATELCWQTALDNKRAQTVYDRIGGKQDRWLDYSIPARTAS
jgi:GNAT superfamily N-acetyltransferase